MKHFTFLKPLLMAIMLVGGASYAWADGTKRTLNAQNYESADAADWTSPNGTVSLITGDATYGKYAQIAPNGSGNRSTYKSVTFGSTAGTGYTTSSVTTSGYVVEFDMLMRSGQLKQRSQSEFVIPTTGPNIATNNTYSGNDYVFALSQPQRDDDDPNHGASSNIGYDTNWYINDPSNSTGNTVTLATDKWYHYELVVTSTYVAYTITKVGDAIAAATGSKTVTSLPVITGFWGLLGRQSGLIQFDNLDIYDYTEDLVADAPTFAFSSVSGENRVYTITNPNGEGTLYYTTVSANEAPAVGDAAYSSTTNASANVSFGTGTYYAYAVLSDGTTTSIITSQSVTGGVITLNTPVISRTGATSVSLSAPQSVLGEPTATIYYRIGNSGEYSIYNSSLTVSTHNTVYAYAAADGYGNSSTVDKEIGFVSDLPSKSSVSRVTSYTSGALDLEEGIVGSAKTYYPLVIDGDQWGDNIYFQNGGWGFRSGNTWYNNSASSTLGYIMFTNLIAGDVVFIEINEGAKTLINAEYVETYSYPGHYAYRALCEGNMELRFMRKDDKNNNLFESVNQYGDPSYAILDCKRYETSSDFATAVAAKSFASAAEVYAFHTAWQIAQAKASSSNDITKVIRNAAIASGTDWANARIMSGEKYTTGTGAPDEYYLDQWQATLDAYQTIYGLPAGSYKIKAATRGSTGASGNIYVYAEGQANTNTAINTEGNTGGTLGQGWSWTEVAFTLTATSDVKIGFYADASATSQWAGCDDWHLEITGVSAKIGSTGWTTFASAYPLNLYGMTASTGSVTAYYASSIGEGFVRMTSTESIGVAAGEGLMLKGTSGATITIPVAASGEVISGNMLVGCPSSTPLTTNSNYYVLVNNGGTAQFQSLAENGATIPAGKAYLNASIAGVKALRIVFEDTETGVESIEHSPLTIDHEAGAMFDLSGRRVSKAQKGIFIANGKKVVVK